MANAALLHDYDEAPPVVAEAAPNQFVTFSAGDGPLLR